MRKTECDTLHVPRAYHDPGGSAGAARDEHHDEHTTSQVKIHKTLDTITQSVQAARQRSAVALHVQMPVRYIAFRAAAASAPLS